MRMSVTVAWVSVAAVLFSVALARAECLSDSFFRHMYCNLAVTKPDHGNKWLRTRTYRAKQADVIAKAAEIIGELSRWKVVESDPAKGRLAAEAKTRIFRWTDDVTLTAKGGPRGTCTVNVRSKSRVGKGDMGQNARNIKSLLRRLDEAFLE